MARHLLSQVRYHQHCLDRAISGDPAMPYPAERVDHENRVAVDFLSSLSGPDAIAEFLRTAGRFSRRMAQHWELEVGYPGGSGPMADNCAMAALEYYLHAWDLAQVTGDATEPADVEGLIAALSRVEQRGTTRIARLAGMMRSRRAHVDDGWSWLLVESGRSPTEATEDYTDDQQTPPTIDLRSDGKYPGTDASTDAFATSD